MFNTPGNVKFFNTLILLCQSNISLIPNPMGPSAVQSGTIMLNITTVFSFVSMIIKNAQMIKCLIVVLKHVSMSKEHTPWVFGQYSLGLGTWFTLPNFVHSYNTELIFCVFHQFLGIIGQVRYQLLGDAQPARTLCCTAFHIIASYGRATIIFWSSPGQLAGVLPWLCDHWCRWRLRWV